MIAEMVSIKTRDGVCETYVAYPESRKNLPIVLFYMDAIGLRPRIYAMVEKLAANGYFVLAPNILYRTNPVPLVDYDHYLKPDRIGELLNIVLPIAAQLKIDKAQSDVQEFLNYARAQPQVNADRVGTVGYCLGGGQALRAAGNYPQAFQAVASFHAGNLATDAETSPHLFFTRTQAELYIAHADQDKSMPSAQIKRVEEVLESMPVKTTAELFAGCLHGWTMSDVPAYHPEGEQRHWDRLLNLFARKLYA